MLKSPDKAEEEVEMNEEEDRATSDDLFATRRPRRKQGSLCIFLRPLCIIKKIAG